MVSSVRDTHAELFACIYGLGDRELKGRQGLSLALCPAGTAVQAEAIHPSLPSAAGRVGATATCRQPRTCVAAGAYQGRGAIGDDSDVRCVVGWEHR